MPVNAESVEFLVQKAISQLSDELEVVIPVPPPEDYNFLDELDSLDVVNLIMETESLVEREFGLYVPLANEKSFDLSASSMLAYRSWVIFVRTEIEKNNG